MFGWAHPTMLAPMEGITHPTFRTLLAANGGVGVVCTEFVRVAGEVVSPKHMARQVVRSPGTPLSVQIMGTHAELMADAAGAVAAAGADIVDVNLGCPAPRVVRKGAGSAMLANPALLYEVLAAMRDRVPGVMSAKIRAGFDDASGVVETARIVERAGVDFLIVHPRRRADFYEGVADWRITATLVRELRIPVVGNGDCWYAADAHRMRAETGCAAVMIGRPAIRNPWIFRQIAELEQGIEPFSPAGDDIVRWLDELTDKLAVAFPGRRGFGPLGRVKEMVTYLGRGVDDGGEFRREALRLPDVDAVLGCARARLAGLPASALDLGARGGRLETSGSARVATERASQRESEY
ncbi:MAG: tRNA-dihydrouridine synthase family protein [Myxococcales bacterium]|nr:tRNA-dihydrouridine synthase family protein [Myxococcales bacterium]MCB9530391.1 tRNA-dihydrouridine synthase family protein [Myxococcales bacterium]MCB9533638.1 tRNA-dihydrouridine synthase family protein [Myxococcales bacterium]